MLKNNWHNAYLHSHNYQHCLKMVEQNWKSFFSAVKDYKKNPGKYKAAPRPPRYKNTVTRKNEVVFTSLAVRFKDNTLMLSLARALQRLVQMIEYKAQLEGIRVIKVNEAYTSGCSAFDLEKISNKSYNSGRRIQRGLFRTNSGLVVNSDVNGSLNIMRKLLKDRCIPNMIQSLRDNGCVDHPRRIRVA